MQKGVTFYSRALGPTLLFSFLLGSIAAQPSWKKIGTVQQPPTRLGGAMAYDAARGKVVLFGGMHPLFGGGRYLSDTWTWDGRGWTELHPKVSPPPRAYHSMAYDSRRRKVVLFGGLVQEGCTGSPAYLQDTWEWDGMTWAQVKPTVSPEPRAYHSLLFDPIRGKVLLVGGDQKKRKIFEIWEWDGVKWSWIHHENFNPGMLCAAAYDPASGKVLVYCAGGGFPGAPPGKTYLYDGRLLKALTPSASPPVMFGFSLTTDPLRKKVLLFGGRLKEQGMARWNRVETWEWNGKDWRSLSPKEFPLQRQCPGTAFDEKTGRILLFGGGSESNTWMWNGTTWNLFGAPGWKDLAAVCDTARNRLVLVGERGGNGLDTWEYDGKNWIHPHPSARPPTRSLHALAWDPARKETVLFGGTMGPNPFSDTWVWDGRAWEKKTGAGCPAPRGGHSMAFDPKTRRVLLFGGYIPSTSHYTNAVFLNDMWAWNGKAWSPLNPSRRPAARAGFSMSTDPVRGKVVLFGGGAYESNTNKTIEYPDTWEWDGLDWSLKKPSLSPSVRNSSAMIYDPQRGRTVLFGGYGLSDTWEWDGKSWSRIPAYPYPSPGRVRLVLVHCPFLGKTLLLGGGVTSEIWEYSVPRRASFQARGRGCKGSNGLVPVLGAKTPPCLGREFILDLKNAPFLTATVLSIGLAPVNFDLGSLGAPGCGILNNPDLTLPNVTNFSGVWTFPHTFSIPLDPSLSGGRLYLQVLLLDRRANRLGLTVTNGGLAVVDW